MMPTDPDDILISTYERRRRAPLHYHAKADNARFNAYILAHAEGMDLKALADGANYGGSPEIAVGEGFNREASLALELIVKAVIAQRLELREDIGDITRVPSTHNVPDLWGKARLPKMPPEDYGRLVIARVYLMWANRYAAPNRDADGTRDYEEIMRHATDRVPGVRGLKLTRRRSFAWDDVRRIYQVANGVFWQLRNDAGL